MQDGEVAAAIARQWRLDLAAPALAIVPLASTAITAPTYSPGYTPPLDVQVGAWLHSKARSQRTHEAYSAEMSQFRTGLQASGLDLDSDPAMVALAAQAWCARPGRRGRPSAEGGQTTAPASATFNQRRACLSSFYAYAGRMGWQAANPLARLTNQPTQDYARSQPLAAETVAKKLAAIPRRLLAGRRDHALLSLALMTGRRLAEVAALRWQEVADDGEQVLVTWLHCKGGKVMRDRLPAPLADVMRKWRAAAGDAGLLAAGDAPCWPSLASNYRGRAMSAVAIADVCEQRIGTSKFHALRHTFAHTMRAAGGSIEDVQARLGHENASTTSRYLAALASADNAHADALADLFGLAGAGAAD